MSDFPIPITCIAEDGSSMHYHSTWDELQRCVGVASFIVTRMRTRTTPKAAASEPMRTDSGPDTGVSVRHRDAPATGRQLWKVEKEGGSWRDAFLMNREQVSYLIGMLLDPAMKSAFTVPRTEPLDNDAWEAFPQERAWLRGELPAEWAGFNVDTGELNGAEAVPLSKPAPVAEAPVARYDEPVYDRRRVTPWEKERENLKTMLPLLEHVKDGYYAAKLGTDAHNDLKFFRVSRPTRGRYDGCIKVQWQMADRWEECWVLWPSGKMSWYVDTFDVASYILTIISDPTGATRMYAKMIDKCCRCNTTLTDERSRHYGIGPECEKHRPDIIVMVDLEDQIAREEMDRKYA